MQRTGIITRLILAVILAGLAPAAALAQAQVKPRGPNSMAVSHSVAVIGPNRPIFDDLLERWFPGASGVNYYETVKPLLAIVHNNTRNVVKAYVVKWTITNADGSTATEYLPVMSEPGPGEAQLTGERTVLGPGGSALETELVSPYFRLPRNRFAGLLEINAVLIHFQAASLKPLASNSRSATSIQTTLDGAIFDDGVFVGPNTFKLYERFQASQQAEVDEAGWMLNQLSAGLTDQQLRDSLSQHIYQGRTSSSTNTAGFYGAARGEEASRLLSAFDQGGHTALRHEASALAGARPLALTKQAAP
jgi:hypothetical protein